MGKPINPTAEIIKIKGISMTFQQPETSSGIRAMNKS